MNSAGEPANVCDLHASSRARSTAIAAYYRENPRMVSSPFGGIDTIDSDLLGDIFQRLEVDVSGKSVLDIGCGRGFAGELVRAQGGRYTGVDLVPSRAGFPLSLGDASALPYRDASFDAVVCIDGHHQRFRLTR